MTSAGCVSVSLIPKVNLDSKHLITECFSQLSACLQTGASLVASLVKNPPVIQETWFLSQGQEDPLEKGMVTHPAILA